jgi:2-polyprenyl-3-methyl-5-hydroxy-6-metoxy-1,4-benzoquinol methylase
LATVLANYNDTDYQAFWKNRQYEDFSDKLAIKRLLKLISKLQEKTLIDIGGGFGRLATVYLPLVKKATLFDYSDKLLQEAKQIYGKKLETIQGSVYNIQEKKTYDIAQMVRVSHHVDDLPTVLAQIKKILNSQGHLIIEIANKRHLVEVLRFMSGQSKISPFDHRPESRNEKGFFNYHPKYVENLFQENNWQIIKRMSVSNFRSSLLKHLLGHRILSWMEFAMQKPLSFFTLSPSIYYLLQKRD